MTTTTPPTFGAWLRKQADRDDPVGDLARDYRTDGSRAKTPEGLRRRMEAVTEPEGPDPDALTALARAVAEWEQEQ